MRDSSDSVNTVLFQSIFLKMHFLHCKLIDCNFNKANASKIVKYTQIIVATQICAMKITASLVFRSTDYSLFR